MPSPTAAQSTADEIDRRRYNEVVARGEYEYAILREQTAETLGPDSPSPGREPTSSLAVP